MYTQFESHISNNLSFLKESKLLIAISGGLDSVVLTHLCHKLNFDIHLAHCNFNLRDEESDADEEFILDLAEKLEIEVFIESFDTENYAQDNKLSIQMAARELRYNWFQELAQQLQFDYILTAHHADDNLETFLINLSRGTGLDGLTGIPETNGKIVRPLLTFSRNDILKYAEDNQLKWREDSSNASTKYLRNKLRHEVIPTLKAINPQFLDNLKKTQNHLQGSQDLIDDAVKRAHEKVITTNGDKLLFDIEALQTLSNTKAYLYELLKDYGFTQWNDVYNLLNTQSGKFVTSHSHRLVKDRTHLILIANTVDDFGTFEVLEQTEEISFGTYKLTFRGVDNISTSDHSSIFVDKDLLKYPLIVRKWEKGDYFYPFGMTGKKKLSKYFKDEKWSLLQKEETLVLVSNNGKIIWIINRRMDDRFKVTNDTKTIVKIQLTQ